MKSYTQEVKRINDEFKLRGYSLSPVRGWVKIFLQREDLGESFDFLEKALELKNLPKTGTTLKKSIIMYGEEMGRKKWKEYCERQAYTNSKEYKNMTDDEFREYNKSRSQTLEKMILRHGEELGRKKWKEYCERQAYTNTLQYYIEKYGIHGEEKWRKLNRKKSNSLESYIEKFDDFDIAFKSYLQYKDRFKSRFYSEMSQDFFDIIDKDLPFRSYYARKNKEFGKYSKELNRYFYYDYVIPELKFCIEFNGDCFHANPMIYSDFDTPNPFNTNLTSRDIWEFDKIKNSVLYENGFEVLVIWEHDYNNNKELTINNVIEYIRKKIDEYNK